MLEGRGGLLGRGDRGEWRREAIVLRSLQEVAEKYLYLICTMTYLEGGLVRG